jgi:hypothetical protein
MCVPSAARWRTRRHSSNPRQSDKVGPSLVRMRTEDIGTVAAEAFEVVEDDETR